MEKIIINLKIKVSSEVDEEKTLKIVNEFCEKHNLPFKEENVVILETSDPLKNDFFVRWSFALYPIQ